MRERMERFILLPFSVGCVSESSVAVGVQQPRKSKADTNPSPTRPKEVEKDDDDEEESFSGESTQSSFRSSSLRKPNISTGTNRLFKGFKNLSQYFVFKEEMEELEMDMEIGGPTDVKHVTHIGWDGPATINDAVMGWKNLISPDLLSVSSDPWRQSFDFSMAAQVPDQAPLVKGSAS